MITTLISFIGLYVSVFTLLLGLGFLGFFLSLRMTLQGFGPQLVGWIMAAYFWGMVLGSFFCQRLIAAVGHIRAFAAFAAVATSAVLLHGLYGDPFFWWVLRLLTGVATMGLYMVIESWLNECTEARFRGRVFSIYMLILYLGMALGQLFPLVSNVRSQQPFLIIGILFSLCLVPIAVTHCVSPQIPRLSRFNLLRLLKRAPLGLLGCLSAGLINGAFFALGPVFGNRIGLSVSQTAWFMGITVFGGLLFQWPIGIISDRFNRAQVLGLLSVLTTIGGLGIAALSGARYELLLLVMGLYGGLISSLYPVAVARTHDLFELTDIIPVSSALLLSYGIGAGLGPLMASSLMALFEIPYGLFAFFSITAGGFALLSFYLVRKEKVIALPVSEQVNFAPMRSSSPVASQLDPRADAGGDPDAI